MRWAEIGHGCTTWPIGSIGARRRGQGDPEADMELKWWWSKAKG